MSDVNDILRANRQEFAALLIATFAFGVYVITAAMSIHFLRQRRQPLRARRITLIYTYFMLVVTIIWYYFSVKTTEILIIELPLSTDNADMADTQYCSSDNIVGTIFSTLQFFGSDALLLYRAYTIFNRSVLAILFPLAIFISFVGSGVAINLVCVSTQMGGSLPLADINSLGTAFYVLSAGVNLVVTIMITAKLILHRRHMAKLGLPSSQLQGQYITTIGLLVESAAAYSAANIIFVVLFETDNPIQSSWSAVVNSMSFLSQAWIILRFSMGAAFASSRGSNSCSGDGMPSAVRFTRRSVLDPTLASGIASSTTRPVESVLLHTVTSKAEDAQSEFMPSSEELVEGEKSIHHGHAL